VLVWVKPVVLAVILQALLDAVAVGQVASASSCRRSSSSP
jgi:hypothetical protein